MSWTVPTYYTLSIPTTTEANKKKKKASTQSSTPLLHLCTHLEEGKQVHGLMIKTSEITDHYSAGRVAEFYALSEGGRRRSLDYAERVLETLDDDPPSFIYNILIRGNLMENNPLQSFHHYLKMLHRSIQPDHFTFTFLLKASTQLGLVGEQLHSQVLKHGLGSNAHIRNKLIHYYALYGSIDDARKVFDKSAELDIVAWNSMLKGYADNKDGASLERLFWMMPLSDTVTWNTMIAFYVGMGDFKGAIEVFRSMQEGGGTPNRVTLISLLSAIAHLGTLGQGMWVHVYVRKHRVDLDDNLSSALINMYSKCGCIQGATCAFQESNSKIVDTWNAMITGFAANGLNLKALQLFSSMQSSQVITPNAITYSCILNACSHGGLVDEGIKYFREMTDKYAIQPDIAHFGCMVDLFCRAGLFREAEEIISTMPMEPDAVMWKAILGACRIHGNFQIGEKAGVQLIELAPGDNAGYVLLSNIYAMANNWDGVHKVRKLMWERGIKKVPGCSSIESDGMVHEFIAGDTKHCSKKEIYEMLDEMSQRLKLAGYEPNTDQVLLDIEEEEVKEGSLFHHSEKLAIAFGFITTTPGTTIRVVKNLRVCSDCHSAIKLLSEIYKRDIVVRDSNRFHHFSDGFCSCMDYW